MELNRLRKLGTFAKLLQTLFEKTMTINVKPHSIILKLNLDPQFISTSEYGPPPLGRFIPPTHSFVSCNPIPNPNHKTNGLNLNSALTLTKPQL